VSAREKWREHVRAWRASGKSAADYCDRAAINPHTLSWWAWKLGSEMKPARPAPARNATTFVELAPLEFPACDKFEIEVGSVLVHVPSNFDGDALRRLLDTLEARR
jgi:hypothetical protein